MSSAQTEDDYLRAAQSYQKLVDSGVRNGPLFYNLGTALLKAGLYEDAAKALVRAERFVGSNWEIRRNLLIAVKGRTKDKDAVLPWYRFPLFWHYGLPASTRTDIAVLAFAGVWLALILRRLSVGRLSGRLLGLCLVLLVLFGSSAATSIHQENRETGFHIDRRRTEPQAPLPEHKQQPAPTEDEDRNAAKGETM